MLLPSSIQRAEDLVSIAMPTVPLLWANAPVTAAAAKVAASARAVNVVLRWLMLHSLDIKAFVLRLVLGVFDRRPCVRETVPRRVAIDLARRQPHGREIRPVRRIGPGMRLEADG